MKIAVLVHFYIPYRNAGSETMLHEMLSYLSRRGHTVEVMVTHIEDQGTTYELDGVTVHSLPRGDGTEYIKELKPDVLITHHDNTKIAGKLSKNLRCKLVYLVHNDFENTIKLRDQVSPDLVVYNTHWINEKHGRPKVFNEMVMHPPINVKKHRTKPGDHITLINLNENKGGLVLQELARRMPEYSFMGVVGGHGEQHRPKEPIDNLTIVEHTDDMKTDVWANTKILLAPSQYESFGMVGLEAMCSGIPVIASPEPGFIESMSYAAAFASRRNLDDWQRAIEAVSKSWAAFSKLAKGRIKDYDNDYDDLSRFANAVENLR